MARKKKHEEHENHERWLVSYADFITLLFAFFVVMYAVSSVNEGKYRVLSDSINAAFRAQPHSFQPIPVGSSPETGPGKQPMQGIPSLIPLPIPVVPEELPPENTSKSDGAQEAQPEPDGAKPPNSDLAQIADEIVEAMDGLIKDDLINVRRDERWLEVEIKSSILYPSGSARLSPPAYPMLEKLAQILARFPNPVHVEGFTDNIPISNIAFLSNWELAAARAASVVHLFTEYGVAPQRMAAIGYGEYKPVADNATPEGRAKNRRVVLVVMPGEDPRWVDEPEVAADLYGDAATDEPTPTAPATGTVAQPSAAGTAAQPPVMPQTSAPDATNDPFISAPPAQVRP
ncbi:MAG TPA: flagellar motor protein MotD [Gammaproteobacteria bacterium]